MADVIECKSVSECMVLVIGACNWFSGARTCAGAACHAVMLWVARWRRSPKADCNIQHDGVHT